MTCVRSFCSAAKTAGPGIATGWRTKVRILVVEDDPFLGDLLKKKLTEASYAVDLARHGEDGFHLGDTEPYDAVVLDMGLPGMDGKTILERWRAAGKTMPVLILTARDKWDEKVAGLDAGADDYMTKPYKTEELLARLRALMRRSTGHASASLNCGELSVDTSAARAFLSGEPIKLTAHEYRVLSYLIHHKGKVVPRTELVDHIYKQDFDRDSNTIEVFIGRLRRKIGSDRIQTERGLGYRLVDPEGSTED